MSTGQLGRVIDHLRRVVSGDGGEGSDGELLAAFLTYGEQGAFEALVQRHGRMVLGVCQRVLHHSHDAEDAFQATFLVLVRKAGSLVSRQNIGDWLYGVACNTALKARATALRQRAIEKKAAETTPDWPLEDIWHELRPLLDQELHRLPQKYREPVVLCDLEGKTRKQAAHQLGWPEGTVSGRLSRARVLLANRLSRHGVALSGGALALVLAQQAATASVPATLLVSTAHAATLVVAGQALVAGILSTKVAALTEGVIRAMFITKLKIATVVMLTVGMVGTGAGVLTWRAAAAGERPGPGEKRDGEPRRPGDGVRLFPPGIERLDLSEGQKDRVARLQKEFQVKLDAARKKLEEKIEDAKQNQDREKIEAALQGFRKEVGKLQEEANRQLGEVLSDEQKARLGELQRRQPDHGGPDLLRILAQLDLNPEQREKVERLVKETAEKSEMVQRKFQDRLEQAKKDQDREKVQVLIREQHRDMGKIHEDLVGKVMEVLTPEQRRKFGELAQRRGDRAPGIGHVLPPPLQERLGLSPEQREKVARLQMEMEAKLKNILSEEQNRTLDAIRKGGDRPRPRE